MSALTCDHYILLCLSTLSCLMHGPLHNTELCNFCFLLFLMSTPYAVGCCSFYGIDFFSGELHQLFIFFVRRSDTVTYLMHLLLSLFLHNEASNGCGVMGVHFKSFYIVVVITKFKRNHKLFQFAFPI